MDGVGGLWGGKWRYMYLNNNIKNTKNKIFKKATWKYRLLFLVYFDFSEPWMMADTEQEMNKDSMDQMREI